MNILSILGNGFPGLADLAPLIARLGVGLMFLLSGYYKLFSAKSAQTMRDTMVEAGIVAPRETATFVSVCEFVFGALLVIGLLTSAAAAVLFIISLVALITVARKSVKGTQFAYRLSSYLDLPETLLMIILFWLMVSGPGQWSLDHALFFRVN